MYKFVRPRSTLTWRSYSTQSTGAQKSSHAQWYADIVPAMFPIFLLGSAVYLGLQLTQQKLSHQKYMEKASQHISALEAEVEALQAKRKTENETPNHTPSLNKTSRWLWW